MVSWEKARLSVANIENQVIFSRHKIQGNSVKYVSHFPNYLLGRYVHSRKDPIPRGEIPP
jgi:hypothetical protein